MPGTVGSGKIYAGSDFTGGFSGLSWTADLVTPLEGGVALTCVNEGSFASTVDETGGILAITTDTGDNDNAALFAGVFAPRDGKIITRARFKYSNVDCAVFFGLTETLNLAGAPVMPAEFSTATMTYNGTGGMIGFNYDVDGTTDDWRAVMGDGGAAISDSSNGISVTSVQGTAATLTADNYVVAEVILNEDGSGECWLGHAGDVDSSIGAPNLRLIKRFSSGTLLTTTDVFHAVLMIENRSGNARTLEVDYFYAEGGRDWRA